MTGKPITPSEVGKRKEASIPEAVFDAFNEAIAKHWNGRSSVVMQKEVVDLIMQRMPALSGDRARIFDNKWLDVEDAYRRAGWTVVYDRPGYCESYEANFTFTKK